MGKTIDLTGRIFGRLTVIRKDPRQKPSRTFWVCRCECAKEVVVKTSSLTTGRRHSCGCLLAETAARMGSQTKTHGLSRKRAYGIWVKMQHRCYNPKCRDFKNYGGRNISVCDRWRGQSGLMNFCEDMGEPADNLSLDRIDNDGNYEPGNCRWATKTEQARNRRSARNITFGGKTQTAKEWAVETGIKHTTILSRLKKGLGLDEVFYQGEKRLPPRKK